MEVLSKKGNPHVTPAKNIPITHTGRLKMGGRAKKTYLDRGTGVPQLRYVPRLGDVPQSGYRLDW